MREIKHDGFTIKEFYDEGLVYDLFILFKDEMLMFNWKNGSIVYPEKGQAF